MVKSHLLYRLSYRTTRRGLSRAELSILLIRIRYRKFHSDIGPNEMRVWIKRDFDEPEFSIKIDRGLLFRVRFKNNARRAARPCKFNTRRHQFVAHSMTSSLRR